MAIRKRGSRFQVYWTNPFTKRREGKACLTKEEAEKLDAQIKYKLVYEREEFRPAGVEEEPAPANTIEAVHYLYLKEKQFNKKGLYWQLDAMRPAYRAFGGLDISDIATPSLEDYKAKLMSTGVAPVTVRGRLSVLRTVLNWAHKRGMLEQMPRFPELPPARYEHFVPPSPGELSRMIDAAPEHIRRIIILGAQTGARIGPCELFRLTWDDVDFERLVIRMPSANKNRNEPWREIPIRESLRSVLAGWRVADGPDVRHVINYKGSQLRTNIQTSWENTLKRAGITRRIRPYDLRHYFATEMIAAGVDLGTVAHLLGHTGTTMLVQHYQHVLTKQKKLAIEMLPDVPVMCQAPCAKKLKALTGGRKGLKLLERETGFEPATFSLGSFTATA